MRILFTPFATTKKSVPVSAVLAIKTQTNFKPDPETVRSSNWPKNH